MTTYSAVARHSASSRPDPYLRPQTSARSRLARGLWNAVYVLLFRPSPRPLHGWRSMLLRCFGARLGASCHVYPHARIWAPWNLTCADVVAIADEAEIYNPEPVHIGSHAVISQQAFLCGATHDPHDPAFPMISARISIGAHAWVCARATVLPGIDMGEGSVLALGGVATRSLAPWTIHGGVPAVMIGARRRNA